MKTIIRVVASVVIGIMVLIGGITASCLIILGLLHIFPIIAMVVMVAILSFFIYRALFE